jgi:hypothetical protein
VLGIAVRLFLDLVLKPEDLYTITPLLRGA